VLTCVYKLLRFVAAPTSYHLRLVRSLTVCIPPLQNEHSIEHGRYHILSPEDLQRVLEDGSRPTQDLWRRMRGLTERLSHLTDLTTFSFHIAAHHESHAPDGFWLPHSIIYETVKSLPGAIQSLEVDTRGFDNTTADNEHQDICTAIANQFPHLEYVRLR
jgi:hypothetical protein